MLQNAGNRTEIYISDLYAYAVGKGNLSPYSSKDKWEYVSYETSAAKGNLLIASSESRPSPVVIDPKLSGWYKIYVCLGEICGSFESSGIFKYQGLVDLQQMRM